MARVIINVSGVHFEFDRKLLDDKKFHRLTRMCEDASKNGIPLHFVEDRPSESFAAILAYYQTGELHMPTGICPGSFKKELEYWEIEQDELSDCCLYRYHAYLDETETRQTFLRDTMEPVTNAPFFVAVTTGSSVAKFRTRLWNVVDNRENSVIAKVYFVIVMLMVLVSIINTAFSTVPRFQRSLSKCEMLEYLKHSGHKEVETVKIMFKNPDCSNLDDEDDSGSLDEDEFDTWYYYYYEYYSDYNDSSTTGTSVVQKSLKDLSIPYLTIRRRPFEIVDYLVVAFFTVDTILRLSSCPSLLKYFTSIVNIIEIMALAGGYTHLIVVSVQRHRLYEETWIRIIDYFQVFRALRLFRIVRNVRASKVLAYSVRQNLRDGTMLAVLMLVGLSTFATLFFFIEKRSTVDSIPLAWYWAVITMTTVGYGDISPKTAVGRVLAAMCACCGVILLAVALPLFVNNFLTLYQFSVIDETIQRKKSLKKKLKDAIHVVSVTRQNIKPQNMQNDKALKASKIGTFPEDVD